MGKHLPGFAALILLASFVAACDARDPIIRIDEVQGPPGGAVFTITSVESNGERVLAAPSEFDLFLRGIDEWIPVQSQLLPSFRLAPYHELRLGDGQFTYPRERLFTGWDKRLWFLTRAGSLSASTLWVSSDVGRTWYEVALPRTNQDAEPPQTARATDPFRLVTGNAGLFLVHGRQVWQYRDSMEAHWKPLSMDGIAFEDGENSLPAIIRNYLPAAPDRDFEVLTVLSDSLMIYRRTGIDNEWMLTSTFTNVDRELVGVPDSQTIFLLSPDALYRSDDQGEQWFRSWPSDQDVSLEAIAVVPSNDSETRYSLLVGAADGSIRRSSTAALEWEIVHQPLSDARRITGFEVGTDDHVWASSVGSGVLASTDGGKTWIEANENLRATRPLDATLGKSERLMVANEAGTFELLGDPTGGRWKPLHANPSAAVQHDHERGVTLSGTLDGRIIEVADDGVTILPWPEGAPSNLEVKPNRIDGFDLPAAAVVGIEQGPDDEWLAASRANGLARKSRDEPWKAWDLSNALVTALSRSTVSRLLVGADRTVYLTERSVSRGTPTQLWRSTDEGDTWSALHSFRLEKNNKPAMVAQAFLETNPDLLIAANADRLLQSETGGETWTRISGPWEKGRIVGLDARNGRGAVLADLGRHSALFVLDDLKTPQKYRRFDLMWPDGASAAGSRQIYFSQRRLWIVSPRSMFTGTLPIGSGRYEGMGAIIAMLALIIGVLVSFGALKRWGQ